MYNRIDIPLRPHPALALAANLPWYLLALFCLVAASGQPALWHIAGLISLAIGIWRTARALQSGEDFVTGLIIDQDRLRLCYSDGRTQTVRVAPESRLGARLSILKLVPEAPKEFPLQLRARIKGLRYACLQKLEKKSPPATEFPDKKEREALDPRERELLGIKL